MKKYKVEQRPTPILEECYCDKCKEHFEEDELTEIQCYANPVNLAHGEFCDKCIHDMIKNYCRYNFDLGWDQEELDNCMKGMKNAD